MITDRQKKNPNQHLIFHRGAHSSKTRLNEFGSMTARKVQSNRYFATKDPKRQ